MKKLALTKEFYTKLANKSLELKIEGQFGSIIPDGEICYKLDTDVRNHFLSNTYIPCYIESRSRLTEYLLELLGKKQSKIKLSDFPHTILTYYGMYVGNIQKYYSNYDMIGNLLSKRLITIDELKICLHSMLDSLEELGKNGIVFLDQHDGNVMFNGKESKLIDFDSPDYTIFDKHTFSIYESFYENFLCQYVLMIPDYVNEPLLNYNSLKNYIDNLTEDMTILSDKKTKFLVK